MRRASTSARLVRAGAAGTRIIGTPGEGIITRGGRTTLTNTIMPTATEATTITDTAATTATLPPTTMAQYFMVGPITHWQRRSLRHGDGVERSGMDTMTTTLIRSRPTPVQSY